MEDDFALALHDNPHENKVYQLSSLPMKLFFFFILLTSSDFFKLIQINPALQLLSDTVHFYNIMVVIF